MTQERSKTIKKSIKFIIYAIIGTTIAYGVLSAVNWLFMPAYAMEPVVAPVIREKISVQDWVLREVRNAGLNEYYAYMIILNESRWDTEVKDYVNTDKSLDRGLWQINDKHHKEVKNTCAYNYKCATREAIRIIKERGYGEWTTGKKFGLK